MKNHRLPARRWWPVLLTALATALTFSAIAIPSSSAKTSTPKVKPTIVLVHGAWADASSWNAEIRQLQGDGYTVIAPANPLRSLSGDAAYIASVLKSIKGPIVLVGHSYGGAVISDAATGNPNVKALVYVDAFVPAKGESILGLAGKYPGSELSTAITEVPFNEGRGDSGVDVYIKTASYRSVFAADVPAHTAAVMAATQRPVTLAALMDKSGTPAWKTIPSWYLVGRQDKAIPPATQLFMAHRAKSHITEINSSHASLVSHPAAVTKLILAAAKTVR